MSQIAIIGAGAWGSALSIVLGRTGHHAITLWSHEQGVVHSIVDHRCNDLFLSGQAIPLSVTPSNSISEVLRVAAIVVSVMPSQHCRETFRRMRPHLRPDMLFVSATKGLEEQTLLRMTEVIHQVITAENGFIPEVAALSGPSFALEAARGDPTALTIAAKEIHIAETVQREFSDAQFRLYTNGDVIGVELGGALKNIIAIAAGVCHGLGLGHNSIAALITRGLAEMSRLVIACGGRQETMAGLAGLGDLVLTCTGGLSRNRSVGVELGQGRKLSEIIAGMHGMVAEGVFTTYAAVDLARARGIEMPITEQMYAILRDGKPPAVAIRDLMSRSSRSETSKG